MASPKRDDGLGLGLATLHLEQASLGKCLFGQFDTFWARNRGLGTNQRAIRIGPNATSGLGWFLRDGRPGKLLTATGLDRSACALLRPLSNPWWMLATLDGSRTAASGKLAAILCHRKRGRLLEVSHFCEGSVAQANLEHVEETGSQRRRGCCASCLRWNSRTCFLGRSQNSARHELPDGPVLCCGNSRDPFAAPPETSAIGWLAIRGFVVK